MMVEAANAVTDGNISGQFVALLAAVNGLLLAVVAFLPRVQGVIREMRRSDTEDYKKVVELTTILRKLVRETRGTECWDNLPRDLREQIEEEVL